MTGRPRDFSVFSGIDNPTVFIAPVRSGFYRNGGKRVLDILLVLLAMPAVVPIVVLCALGVMLDGGSPFYGQLRVGRGGSQFRMWKLRTMVPDADGELLRYLADNPEARIEWEVKQKLKNDPRITRFGQILRRLSLDELPQLWNVLCGDMSLVGPRPMMPDQQPLYPGHAYYLLRPALTGPWQVSDRNACSFAARASYDDVYERDVTLASDVRIMLATIRVVLRATGY
jgi:lipopolysaccharide/colanic/teichoic acid biosynthesis glycosyltransferase